jgi:class I fructose-bisphosphate aldolase
MENEQTFYKGVKCQQIVMRNLQTIFDHGRLAGTGYLSIIPGDQGIEHSAGSAFAPNPIYYT